VPVQNQTISSSSKSPEARYPKVTQAEEVEEGHMLKILVYLLPAATLALAGCVIGPPSTAASSADTVERNKALVRELTAVVTASSCI